jgi:hypothetical protein
MDANAKLQALEQRIAEGTRVYAERDGIGYWSCSEAMVIKNATLILDEPDA